MASMNVSKKVGGKKLQRRARAVVKKVAKKNSAPKPSKKRVVEKKKLIVRKLSDKKPAISAPSLEVKRQAPGSTGEGHFYHIIIRPKQDFSTFRVQDVGARGGLERVAGQRPNGSWDTQAWLVAKSDARVRGGKLELISSGARSLLKSIDGAITHVQGDIWRAHERRNVPEHEKPTEAQRTAWNEHIHKAQAAKK